MREIQNNRKANMDKLGGVVKKTLNLEKVEDRVDRMVKSNKRGTILLDKLIPAPIDWNFYGLIPASKMAELIESITTIGLLHPIVVWEQSDGMYMILSGHNRVHAYNILRENENSLKYQSIDAIIKGVNEIDNEIAQQIIIDTNWVQRELTPIQKAKSISKKYTQLKKEASANQLRIDINEIIAKEYNISKRQIINYKDLHYLLAEIQTFIDNGKISIKTGTKLAKLDSTVQAFIYDNYIIDKEKCKIVNKKAKLLLAKSTIENVEEIFVDIEKEEIGEMVIKYPDVNNKEFYKTATITYPKEDCKYFLGLIEQFCGSNHDLIIMEDSTYKNGDFVFSIIK